MPKQQTIDTQYRAYVAALRSNWIVKSYHPLYLDEVAAALWDNGLLIDVIDVAINHSNDPSNYQLPTVTWYGICCDDAMRDFKFEARWALDMELFSRSGLQHYYVLDYVDVNEVRPYEVVYDNRELGSKPRGGGRKRRR